MININYLISAEYGQKLEDFNTSKEAIKGYRNAWSKVVKYVNTEVRKKDFNAAEVYDVMLEALKEENVNDPIPIE